MEFDRSHKRPRALSLIGLINVIFMLLIFFLVAGNIERFEVIEVDLPTAKTSKSLEDGPLVIVLGRHDELLVDDELIGYSDLTSVLTEKLQQGPQRVISVKVDASLPASRFIRLMDVIKAAGGKNISLATQEAR